jgi:hypothetical protein
LGENWTHQTQALPFSQMSDFYLTSLRLSPGDRSQHATLRKKQPPVALERLQALA